MTARVISDRELVIELARHVDELAETVADLHGRLERMAVIVDADAGKHSRRFDATDEAHWTHVGSVVERVAPYLVHSDGAA